MVVTSRIFLNKTLSPHVSLHNIVSVVIFHIIYATCQQTVDAYVTYFYDESFSYSDSYRFPSMPSNIGNSFQDNSYIANLFTAPRSNPFMCKSENLSTSLTSSQTDPYRHRRRSLIDTVDDVPSSYIRSIKVSSTQDQKKFLNKNSNSKLNRGLQSRNSLALAVRRGGGCSIEEKAHNIMELNEIYSSPGGPQIEFLVILDNDVNSFDDDEYADDLEAPIDLWISYMDVYDGSALYYLMREIYKLESRNHHVDKRIYLTESSFFAEDGNEWQFQVVLDGIYLTDDRRLLWVNDNTGYLFFGIIIIITISRFLILLIINRGTRWTRNEDGRINGIAWNWPPYRLCAVEGIMTDDQIKKLPTIEYNVSDMKDICRKYNNGEDSDNDDAENVTIDSFKGNAYESITSCPICIEDFEHGEKLLLLPKCGHFYHAKCITPWLKEKSTCAYCQAGVTVHGSTVQQLNSGEEDVAAIRNGNDSFLQLLISSSGNNDVTSMVTSLAPVSDTVTVGNVANSGDGMVESLVECDSDNTSSNNVESSGERRYFGDENVSTQEDAVGRDLVAISPVS